MTRQTKCDDIFLGVLPAIRQSLNMIKVPILVQIYATRLALPMLFAQDVRCVETRSFDLLDIQPEPLTDHGCNLAAVSKMLGGLPESVEGTLGSCVVNLVVLRDRPENDSRYIVPRVDVHPRDLFGSLSVRFVHGELRDVEVGDHCLLPLSNRSHGVVDVRCVVESTYLLAVFPDVVTIHHQILERLVQ